MKETQLDNLASFNKIIKDLNRVYLPNTELQLTGKREVISALNIQIQFLKFVNDFKTSVVCDKLPNKLDVLLSYLLSQSINPEA